MLNTVNVPDDFEPIFEKTQEFVKKYFNDMNCEPANGSIEIFGERYLLIRAASMSSEFFEIITNLYGGLGNDEAVSVARNLLFDIAKTIGKVDARNFHKKMGLKEPIEKLSAGPIYFAHMGWAYVDISPESSPSPDDNFFMVYDHPYSFEADAWIKAGKKSDFPVCIMSAGYSSGWCEESFGINLVASEIMCRAKGDKVCQFVMAHPSKIEQFIEDYLNSNSEFSGKIQDYSIPNLFQRKLMEDALRESESKIRAILQSTADGILVVDKQGHVVQANDSFTKLWRIPSELLETKDDDKLLAFVLDQLEDPGQFLKKVRELYDSSEESYDEITFKDGRIFARNSRPFIHNDQNVGRVWSFRNITTERQMQTKKDELLDEIQQINEELNQFAYTISHDLKAPLRGIQGLSEIIKMEAYDKLDDESKENFDLLIGKAAKMQDLIKGVLEYSRLGRSHEKHVTIDLNRVIEEIVSLLDCEDKIEVRVENPLPVIKAEEMRINQLFQNLISNAVKYMDKEKGLVRINCKELEHFWQLSVSDNGPGIDPQYHEQIFRMFKSLSIDPNTDSTGIGLTLVKRIVEMYGGKIWVESQLGEGCTFIFTIPKKIETRASEEESELIEETLEC